MTDARPVTDPAGPRTMEGHALARNLRDRDAEVDWDAWVRSIEDAAVRSRPATDKDPAGLDVERLAEALVAVSRENLYPGDKGGARWRQKTAERLAAEYARLSVADEPGPEERL